jgi:hypothetical protein
MNHPRPPAISLPHAAPPCIPDSATPLTPGSKLWKSRTSALLAASTRHRQARRLSEAGDPDLVQVPLGQPTHPDFDAIFLAKVAFITGDPPEPDPCSILTRLRKDRLLAEFLRFAEHGLLSQLSPLCQSEFGHALISGLVARPLKLSDSVQTDEWKTAVTDPHWGQTIPFYELLCGFLSAGASMPPFDARALGRLMERTQGSDPRERSAAAKVLSLYYERNPLVRQFVLAGLEAKLIDVRDGHLQPFAGPPLLLCLLKAMECSLDTHEATFRRMVQNAVIPFFTYRYLSELLAPIAGICLKLMEKAPQFGVEVLYALQRNWPLSTRAASTARLAIALFCGLHPQYSRLLVSSFLDFLAACLRSTDSSVVIAALGIFERPNGREFLLTNATEAISRLYAPLCEVRSQIWINKSEEKAQACIDALAQADAAFFAEFTAREAPDLVSRCFPLRQWQSVADVAAACNGGIVPSCPQASALPPDKVEATIPKIVTRAVREQMGRLTERKRSPPTRFTRPQPLAPMTLFVALTRIRTPRSRTLCDLPQPAEQRTGRDA